MKRFILTIISAVFAINFANELLPDLFSGMVIGGILAIVYTIGENSK